MMGKSAVIFDALRQRLDRESVRSQAATGLAYRTSPAQCEFNIVYCILDSMTSMHSSRLKEARHRRCIFI